MVKNKLHIILTLSLSILACDDDLIIVNCVECYATEPVETVIEIKLDDQPANQKLISVYEGNIEDNILLKSFVGTGDEAQVNLKVNKKYTFTATYQEQGGASCVVVNSVFPQVRYETSQCEEPCYYVYNKSIRLKLKYKNF